LEGIITNVTLTPVISVILEYIDYRLMLWAVHKFKRFKGKPQKAKAWLNEVRERDRYLFVHWERMGRVDQ